MNSEGNHDLKLEVFFFIISLIFNKVQIHFHPCEVPAVL